MISKWKIYSLGWRLKKTKSWHNSYNEQNRIYKSSTFILRLTLTVDSYVFHPPTNFDRELYGTISSRNDLLRAAAIFQGRTSFWVFFVFGGFFCQLRLKPCGHSEQLLNSFHTYFSISKQQQLHGVEKIYGNKPTHCFYQCKQRVCMHGRYFEWSENISYNLYSVAYVTTSGGGKIRWMKLSFIFLQGHLRESFKRPIIPEVILVCHLLVTFHMIMFSFYFLPNKDT